jgi:hypothetical protein
MTNGGSRPHGQQRGKKTGKKAKGKGTKASIKRSRWLPASPAREKDG